MGLDHRTYNAASKELVVTTKHLDVLGSLSSKGDRMKRAQSTIIEWQHGVEKITRGIPTGIPGLYLESLELISIPYPEEHTEINLKFFGVGNPQDQERLLEYISIRMKRLSDEGLIGKQDPPKQEEAHHIMFYTSIKYAGHCPDNEPFCEYAIRTGVEIYKCLGIVNIGRISRFQIHQTSVVKYKGKWMTYADFLRGKFALEQIDLITSGS